MEKVKNNITELVFILDRSGSMGGLESDTIGGFNSLIEKQRKQEGECYVSTVLFDNVSEDRCVKSSVVCTLKRGIKNSALFLFDRDGKRRRD